MAVKMRNPLLSNVYAPLKHVSERLGDHHFPWLVGGSTGCLLQGVHLRQMPRDLDIYTDRSYLAHLCERFNEREVQPARYSESERYASYMFNVSIFSVQVEFVANLSVRTAYGQYDVDVGGLLYDYAQRVDFGGKAVFLMPLEHEFVFNLLRERPDRYLPIRDKLRKDGIRKQLWLELCNRSTLSEKFWEKARSYVSFSGEV